MIHPSVSVPVSCALSASTLFLRPTSLRDKGSAPRGETQWAKFCCSTQLRRLERIPPFRCNVVAVEAGGGAFRSVVLQRNEARDLREH